MKAELSGEAVEMFAALVKALGGTEMHINQPYICDHCEDIDKEAFPYHVDDATGKRWEHLCNDCFDALGCTLFEEWGTDIEDGM